MKNNLINHFTWLVNSLSEVNTYDSWSNEYKSERIKEYFDKFYNSLKLDGNKDLIDFKNLTYDQAIELRFSKWSEEISGLMLIPLYLVPLLPIGIELTSINNEKIIYDGNNINKDIRFGCIAYGIIIDKKEGK